MTQPFGDPKSANITEVEIAKNPRALGLTPYYVATPASEKLMALTGIKAQIGVTLCLYLLKSPH